MAKPFIPPPRAVFASDPGRSRGRLHGESPSATRTEFQRDRDRIVHSDAFRRLKQKTQVFVAHEGDHYRTRLTHSLEVSQVARTVARVLGLDEDLAETLALAHDIGHPPFGHAGETALNTAMEAYGGFDHNAQALRVLTRLERRYPVFDGLNLTWETLEGVIKHNGPLVRADKPLAALPVAFRDYDALQSLDLDTFAGPEAQVAALADDIAYNNHDIQDGLRAGLFEIDDLVDVPLAGKVIGEVMAQYPDIERDRLISEAVRRLIGVWVSDLIAEFQRRAAEAKPKSVEDVRALGRPLAAFSEDIAERQKPLRAFLFERMYRHHKVNRMMSQARRIVRELFGLFLSEPETLPPPWRDKAKAAGDDMTKRARVVCDYIAGMTDTYAIEEHRKLFNLEHWV
ncbi:MAG: deoxyguanosinetriphosphate triphosphohydrolase [Alphaproteobacteria bacterium 32-64-14]|nr:MAG: deoxyguanosinetriphosphate triphosphohydrolase [Alphaproteobacteria bacterium 32-64-14]